VPGAEVLSIEGQARLDETRARRRGRRRPFLLLVRQRPNQIDLVRLGGEDALRARESTSTAFISNSAFALHWLRCIPTITLYFDRER
jgi:hypothetical protein